MVLVVALLFGSRGSLGRGIESGDSAVTVLCAIEEMQGKFCNGECVLSVDAGSFNAAACISARLWGSEASRFRPPCETTGPCLRVFNRDWISVTVTGVLDENDQLIKSYGVHLSSGSRDRSKNNQTSAPPSQRGIVSPTKTNIS